MSERIPRHGLRAVAGVIGAAKAMPVNRFRDVNLDATEHLELEHPELDDDELDNGELEPWPDGNPAHSSGFDPSVEGPNPQGRGDRSVLGQPNTVRWGDKATLLFEVGPRSTVVSEQLLQIKLVRPMICSVRLTAKARFAGPLSELLVSTLNLYVGVGSSQQQVSRSWALQPDRLTSLDVTIHDLPLTTLLADISAVGTAVEGQMVVIYNLAVAPTVHT